MSRERSIIERISSENVKWLELQFMDLPGYIHSVHISSRLLSPKWFSEGVSKLDGSSVRGFTEINESDLRLIPVENTYATLPWLLSGAKVGRFICTIGLSMNKGRLEYDSRLVAENLEAYLSSKGLTGYVGAEIEFFVFDSVKIRVNSYVQYIEINSPESPVSDNGYPYIEKRSYYIPAPLDTLADYRARVSHVLEENFGIEVDVHHHEVASTGHIEINMKYSTPVNSCDNILTLKYVSRRVAAEYGLYPTFMPKPLFSDDGSGFHVHISIWKDTQNLFYDPNDDYAEISQYARYFIGGLIEHGRSLSAIVSPTVNSYKRLIPGYEAPVYLAWSKGNRSAAIRVPVYKARDQYKRIEYRPPDPSVNPYLAVTAIFAAGLDGVKRKIEPGDPVDKNIYKLSKRERRELGIKELPGSLTEALEELKSDMDFLKPFFSQPLIDKYIELKFEEARRINTFPSPIEFKEYFNL